jgi:flagellar basal-body rod protein FlgB
METMDGLRMFGTDMNVEAHAAGQAAQNAGKPALYRRLSFRTGKHTLLHPTRQTMQTNLFTDKLDGHGKALTLLAQRQQVLAGNIANADTPGFKARDFDFASALADARTQDSAAQPEAKLQYRAAGQNTLDGNTVDLDRERANFADNALRYEATLRFINNNVRTMLSAITGQ